MRNPEFQTQISWKHFRHGGHGGPEGFPFGPGAFGGFGRGRGRGGFGGRGGPGGGRGRGDLKFEILAVLAAGPRHGYDIMLEIEQKSGMRPSPGSIYPALQMLEDADCVRGEERDGKRTYTITEKGQGLLNERPPEDPASDGNENVYAVMVHAMEQVHGIKDAAKQIARTRNVELFKRAVEVLDRTRRELYAILADKL
jgi:DNA-binding PadR family transcriptional regulator